MTSLACSDLCLGYGTHRVLGEVNLVIPTGKITALIGANGSGKSTLLRAMAGLLRPSAGSVSLDGKPLAAWPRKQMARRLSFLPQEMIEPPEVTVAELVAFGRHPHRGLLGRAVAGDAEAVSRAIAATDLGRLAERMVATLSGGERRRVWIAMALAVEAEILLLDEPTTFLDIGHQFEVLELVQQINRTSGITVVLSLHDLNQAARFADHLVVVDRGTVIDQGAPVDVLTERLLTETFRVSARITRDDGGPPACVPTGSIRSLPHIAPVERISS
jgi:ABC-type cobalamin/Fe3+-siderophores transport system ATPase subunit